MRLTNYSAKILAVSCKFARVLLMKMYPKRSVEFDLARPFFILSLIIFHFRNNTDIGYLALPFNKAKAIREGYQTLAATPVEYNASLSLIAAEINVVVRQGVITDHYNNGIYIYAS